MTPLSLQSPPNAHASVLKLKKIAETPLSQPLMLTLVPVNARLLNAQIQHSLASMKTNANANAMS